MRTAEYEKLLEPHLVAAFASVDWPAGFTPRLLLAVKLHRQAVGQVYHNHEIADPRTKNPDILAIIKRLVSDHISEDVVTKLACKSVKT